MVVLDALGQRWALRILWELRDGPRTFRDLRAACDDVSPSVLNARLKDLRALAVVALGDDGYALTTEGRALSKTLLALNEWAQAWAGRTAPD
jgi:DNA-binding HxlR family transcriptional regulator